MRAARRIFGFWTGNNPMNHNRLRGWATFGVTGLEPTLVTPDTLNRWIDPTRPPHPAYNFLSSVHRSDYLRPYFMYHHGGGYADIKPQTGSWLESVETVERSSWLYGAGYREIRGGSVWLQNAPIQDRYFVLSQQVPRPLATLTTNILRAARPLLIGNCAFYFKPRTPFAREWLGEVDRRLDMLLGELHGVREPEARARLGDGSGYPLPWSAIHGDVLQPMALRQWMRLSRSLPRPSFNDYG